MKSQAVVRLAFIGASVLVAFGAPAAPSGNVLVILADDLGYGDVGFQGCTDIPTPHLDALAASGVRFTNGYVTHPYCSPSRAALMTGRYQHRFGHETNVPYDPQNPLAGLPVTETTIAARLQKQGVATGAVGKWHLGAAEMYHPLRRGFDFFFGFRGGGHQYFDVDLLKPMAEGYYQPLERNNQPVGLDGYLTDVLTDEAIGFIEANAARPFFLYLAYNAPHTPLQAPEEQIAKFSQIQDQKRRVYAAMVHTMDANIGRVLATLDRLHLREKTLVFFLSDNGGPINANGSNNGPLRGAKGEMWEGGIRVPFVASWPGVLPADATYEHPVSSLDISRTALVVGGADPGSDANLDGVDLLPFVIGKQDGRPHNTLFWRADGGPRWAVRMDDSKLVRDPEGASLVLSDLGADIGEQTDLSNAQPERVQQLLRTYEAWKADNVPPAFPGYREYHEQKNAFYKTLP